MTNEINEFIGKYHFLSNFYECNVEYGGIIYNNSEAAFQAQKASDDEIKIIFSNLTPSLAKKLGRNIRLRHDWREIRDDVMYEVCMAKFKQNDDLRKLLIDTGDAVLIEGNTWRDGYWGVYKGKGKNKLGLTLMKVRRELSKE
ncbi:swarming motility protein YbiA [Methanobrevibacter sp. 87.7]|uniref:NADAR family protein n=1 Tax=Methanobrevibacter sp. 87.7 TaxID=387957 RepID=UPI000B4FFFE0|nr:NADAR family protein [Methanobrevibacter sp. 87.7]OWT32779.1 swarming motility protein YbiA [Methanobrevibacter sp. 87.7]